MKTPIKTTALEETAWALLGNALTSMKAQGKTVVQGHCRHCGGKKGVCHCGGKKGVCLLCSLILFRGLDLAKVLRSKAGIERTAATVLALPDRWVIDLVVGFDDDKTAVTYRSAKLIGRKLWRKHGK